MKSNSRMLVAMLLPGTLLAGCAMLDDRDEVYPVGSRVPVEFIDASGAAAGTAILKQMPHGVHMDVELRNLSPGWHGFHVHETGTCDTPSFESAGGHFNPGDDEHGFEAEEGFHAGDLPNIYVGDDGRAQFHLFAERVSLGNDSKSLFDGDGSALVVHAGQDNYRSQPSGSAGNRLACAAIVQASDR